MYFLFRDTNQWEETGTEMRLSRWKLFSKLVPGGFCTKILRRTLCNKIKISQMREHINCWGSTLFGAWSDMGTRAGGTPSAVPAMHPWAPTRPSVTGPTAAERRHILRPRGGSGRSDCEGLSAGALPAAQGTRAPGALGRLRVPASRPEGLEDRQILPPAFINFTLITPTAWSDVRHSGYL